MIGVLLLAFALGYGVGRARTQRTGRRFYTVDDQLHAAQTRALLAHAPPPSRWN